ncbi:MAG: cellulose biosynthesis protein BcsS [Sideroxydans sp.]|nr:cellulose biosynthesis protein BcsS [Sideroxydans sp.]
MQLKYQFSPQTDADFMANYAIGSSSYWSHLRLGYQPRWDWRLDPEFGLQAGQNYRIVKASIFAATPVLGGAMLELNTGLQANLNPPKKWYVGVGLSKNL